MCFKISMKKEKLYNACHKKRDTGDRPLKISVLHMSSYTNTQSNIHSKWKNKTQKYWEKA